MISTKWINGHDNISEIEKIYGEVFNAEYGFSLCEYIPNHKSLYLVVYSDGIPAAAGRLTVYVNNGGQRFFLGPVAVMPNNRGEKLGDLVVRMLIRKSYNMGGERQYTDIWEQAHGFYEKLGFVTCGKVIRRSNEKIPLIRMTRRGDISGHCQ